MKAIFFLSALISASSALAQTNPPPAAPPLPTGQVTGHVTCGDTDQPGRFATVQLIQEKPDAAGFAGFDPSSASPDFSKSLSIVMGSLMKGSGLSTLADIDGNFALEKVPAGKYYVVAQLPGYESPISRFSQTERLKAAPESLKTLGETAQKLVVDANQSARVELRLERGAAISGTVRYDDGSPAAGVNLLVLSLQPDGKWKQVSAGMLPFLSDDRGRYRLFGLLAGKYAVESTLPTAQASAGFGSAAMGMNMKIGDALVVYSGGALRERDIKPIELGAGDEVGGVDIVFPLSGLHPVSGSVVAKADKHAIDTGWVILMDPETKSPLRSAPLHSDGTFRLNYVPEGPYVLSIHGAADADNAGLPDELNTDFARMLNHRTVKTYGNLEQPLLVKADVSGLVLEMPEAKAPSASTAKAE